MQWKGLRMHLEFDFLMATQLWMEKQETIFLYVSMWMEMDIATHGSAYHLCATLCLCVMLSLLLFKWRVRSPMAMAADISTVMSHGRIRMAVWMDGWHVSTVVTT